MSGPPLYRRAPVPSLGSIAAADLDIELRKIEDWGISIEGRLWSGDGCPADEGAVPHYDCFSGGFKPSALIYRNPDFELPYDHVLVLGDLAGTGVIGGIGNIQQLPDSIVLVGSTDVDQWDELALRRPLFMGGSSVQIDAGASMKMNLPAATAYENGYNLELAADGETVLAVPNPASDVTEEDTSADTGTPLLIGTTVYGWAVFPDGNDIQPDKLEVIIPSGTQPGSLEVVVQVRVTEVDGRRSGNITIGVGLNDFVPEGGNQASFTVPGGYSGTLDLVINHEITAELTADLPLKVWYEGQGSHTQHRLETDTANGNHSLRATISYGAGGGGGAADYWGGYYDAGTPFGIGVVDSNFKNLRSFSLNALPNNNGVSVQANGSINLLSLPTRKLVAHVSVSIQSNLAGRTFQIGFATNATGGTTINASVTEFVVQLGGQTHAVHHSAPISITSAATVYARIACVDGSSPTVTVMAMCFWVEFE